jgi:hypothetical protein
MGEEHQEGIGEQMATSLSGVPQTPYDPDAGVPPVAPVVNTGSGDPAYQAYEQTQYQNYLNQQSANASVTGVGDADTAAANLLASQFYNWQSQFKPIELNAMQQLSFNNPAVLTNAVNTAKQTASGSADAMAGILQRQNAAVGVLPTEQQQAVSKRVMDINKATQIAGAENTARENVRTNDEMILTGQAPNPNLVKNLTSSTSSTSS